MHATSFLPYQQHHDNYYCILQMGVLVNLPKVT